MSKVIVGIDLGTTNSEVAVAVDGRIHIVEEDGSAMLPSVVGLDDAGELIVGTRARNQYALYPERTIKSIKRRMGSDEIVVLGGKGYSPQEISAMILRALKQRAERYLGEPVHKAVITVPAFFSDAQRQATRDAGTIAGLEVVRIINEPTSACMAFEHGEAATKVVMAFDLGGGTFDVSIVRMQEDLVEVIGSHGDTHLGGDDFDQLLRDELSLRLHKDNPDKPFSLSTTAEHRLTNAAETAKVRLSESDYTRILEDNLQTDTGEPMHVSQEIRREEFEALIRPLLNRSLDSVYKALAEAKVSLAQIDEILLVGGSTRIPAVGRMLEEAFGKRPRLDVHPDLAVAYGAGVMASRLMGSDDHRILVDITPYTFGTAALGLLNGMEVPYLFCPVIEAGTPLPVTRTRTFYTACHGQREVKVTVFEGENEDARENILLGDFQVQGMDEAAPIHSPVVLRMSLDLDGILHVQATEKNTGLSKDIRIENSLGKLADDVLQQARSKVAGLFGDAEVEWEETESKMDPMLAEVQALIEKAQEQLPNMDNVDRCDAMRILQSLLQKIEECLPLAQIEHEVQELEDLLFYLDSSQ